MIADVLKYAWTNLMHRKLRSFLSVLSILIGIMSIYAILSFGQGLSVYISTLAEEMGTNKIILQQRSFGPPGSAAQAFTEDDLSYINKVKGIDEAAGYDFFLGVFVLGVRNCTGRGPA